LSLQAGNKALNGACPIQKFRVTRERDLVFSLGVRGEDLVKGERIFTNKIIKLGFLLKKKCMLYI
jgi:hypothetical protein